MYYKSIVDNYEVLHERERERGEGVERVSRTSPLPGRRQSAWSRERETEKERNRERGARHRFRGADSHSAWSRERKRERERDREGEEKDGKTRAKAERDRRTGRQGDSK